MADDLFDIEIQSHGILFGGRLFVSFQRTRRLAEQPTAQPAPSSLGALPVHGEAQYSGRVPKEWMAPVGVFLPIVPGEAFWVGFSSSHWKPNAIKIAIGGLDAVSGTRWREGLHDDPQDYLVCPPQLWLDGIQTEKGGAQQFVPVIFKSETKGLWNSPNDPMRIVIFDPIEGCIGKKAPAGTRLEPDVLHSAREVSIQTGSAVAQTIVRDPYGLRCWDQSKCAFIFARWVSPEEYRAITGQEPPVPAGESEGYKGYQLP